MKKLVATRIDDGHREVANITHRTLKSYARRCKADFLEITENKGLHPHYRILQFYDLFGTYDRILSVDSDMLITKQCPNIFTKVPKEKIGVVFEDVGSRQQDRRERIKKVQEQFGDIGWKEGYINTGFAVFSKRHREIFKGARELYMDLGYDDVYLGYMINKFKMEIMALPYEFNGMSMWLEDWCGARKSEFHTIHYAGNGFTRSIEKLAQIEQDYLVLKKYKLI